MLATRRRGIWFRVQRWEIGVNRRPPCERLQFAQCRWENERKRRCGSLVLSLVLGCSWASASWAAEAPEPADEAAALAAVKRSRCGLNTTLPLPPGQ